MVFPLKHLFIGDFPGWFHQVHIWAIKLNPAMGSFIPIFCRNWGEISLITAMFVLQGLQDRPWLATGDFTYRMLVRRVALRLPPKLRGNQAASSEIQDGYDEKTLSKAPSLRPVVGKHRKCGGQPLLTTWGLFFRFAVRHSSAWPAGKVTFFNHTSTYHSTRKDPASIGVLVSWHIVYLEIHSPKTVGIWFLTRLVIGLMIVVDISN